MIGHHRRTDRPRKVWNNEALEILKADYRASVAKDLHDWQDTIVTQGQIPLSSYWYIFLRGAPSQESAGDPFPADLPPVVVRVRPGSVPEVLDITARGTFYACQLMEEYPSRGGGNPDARSLFQGEQMAQREAVLARDGQEVGRDYRMRELCPPDRDPPPPGRRQSREVLEGEQEMQEEGPPCSAPDHRGVRQPCPMKFCQRLKYRFGTDEGVTHEDYAHCCQFCDESEGVSHTSWCARECGNTAFMLAGLEEVTPYDETEMDVLRWKYMQDKEPTEAMFKGVCVHGLSMTRHCILCAQMSLTEVRTGGDLFVDHVGKIFLRRAELDSRLGA